MAARPDEVLDRPRRDGRTEDDTSRCHLPRSLGGCQQLPRRRRVPIDDKDIHALQRSQGSLPTEQKPLSLYRSPSFVNGLLQVIHQSEAGLEVGIEYCLGVFRHRADHSQLFYSNVGRDDHIERA